MKRVGAAVLCIGLILPYGLVFAGDFKGPRIILEEEEVITLDNGKEIRRDSVSHREKAEYLSRASKEALQKIGVANEKEADEKKLSRKYKEELDKLIRVKRIEPPMLRFLDTYGEVVKTLSLSSETKKATKYHAELKRDVIIEEAWSKKAVLSRDNKYAYIGENVSEIYLPSGAEKLAHNVDRKILGLRAYIKHLDVTGKVLWQKRAPKNMNIDNFAVSDYGEVVAFTQKYGISTADSNTAAKSLMIYSREGKRLLEFPEHPEPETYSTSEDVLVSPNGRFISITAPTSDKKMVTIFLDSHKMEFWRSEERYSVRNISDTGVVEARHMDSTKSAVTINLINKFEAASNEIRD